MAKQTRDTFGVMTSTLRSLGFVPTRRGESVVFTHPNAGPVILLPAYKSGEAVKPIHRMMVTKQLVDAGLLEAGAMPVTGHAKAASKSKITPKSTVTEQSKASIQSGSPPKKGHKLEA